MLKILIWMGCVYLIVTALGIVSQPERRNVLGVAAAVLAILSAPMFFFLAAQQDDQSGPNEATAPAQATTGETVNTLSTDDLNAINAETQRILEESNRILNEVGRASTNDS